MKLEGTSSLGITKTRSLLRHLIELPNLASTLQALPAPTFAALVREVGVEDAGELLALATAEQLVQAFDEDLFVSDGAGEREILDAARVAVWFEVLLEAGDEAAAERFAELEESFVAHCLSGLLLVLCEDTLRERLAEADEDEGWQLDKTLEASLTEEIDGYVLVAKQHDGWEAALSLLLALDRNHRALLVRLLDRLALQNSHYLDDLEGLSHVLSETESLAEDVEAAREQRRAQQGYVEPQAARAFLKLARNLPAPEERDPVTRAYFRELDRAPRAASPAPVQHSHALPPALHAKLMGSGADSRALGPIQTPASSSPALAALTAALRELSEHAPELFGARMDELAYLVNALMAGHARDGERLRAKQAADAALATVCYGAILQARRSQRRRKALPGVSELAAVLRHHPADWLFRRGSSALASGVVPTIRCAQRDGLLWSAEELDVAIQPVSGLVAT